MEFTTVQGDIAAQRADALVNAAGTSLRMGSGVAGALQRGANGPVNEEAMGKAPWISARLPSPTPTTSTPTT